MNSRAQDLSALPLIAPRLGPNLDRRGTSSGEVRDPLQDLYSRLSKGSAERRAPRDRRASVRVTVELECEERDGDSVLVRLTNDLSTFGVSMREGPTPKTGSRLGLTLFLPGAPDPIVLEAEVLGPWDTKGGTRLKFVRPTLEAVRRIHRFLAAQR